MNEIKVDDKLTIVTLSVRGNDHNWQVFINKYNEWLERQKEMELSNA